jgi:rhomboid protease GluP
LLLNKWALWALGPMVERMLGNLGFAITYLVSGLTGSLASLYWNVDGISAGASGAIFGVVGGMLGFYLRQRSALPRQLLLPLRNAGLTFVIVNVAFGLSVPHIDMAAHLGGLLGGLVCSYLVSQPLDAPARPQAMRALLVLVAFAGVLFAGIQGVKYLHADAKSRLTAIDLLERAASRVEESAEAFDAGQLSMDVFSERLEREVLPACRKAQRALPSPESVDAGERENLRGIHDTLATLTARLNVLNEALHTKDRAQVDRALNDLFEEHRRSADPI